MYSSLVASTVLCLLLPGSQAALDLGFHDDSDLTQFVTRPEIKAPRFNVSVYDTSRVTPGYWFVAPYANVRQETAPEKYYQPCQTGPSIYDGNGELIWSGACLVENQNTCDFRAWEINGSSYLSGMLMHGPKEWQGHGFVLDSSYKIANTVIVPPPILHFNMHEFNLLENGRTALHVINKPIVVDLTYTPSAYDTGWILDMGFREVDVLTGETKFSWWAVDQGHVDVTESRVKVQGIHGPPPGSWDWFHGNAVDKNEQGDYLFNARHTDTMYKISGKDGSVIWRLGGINSTFVQEGFNFSRQHDARFLGSNNGEEIISFLDNAADLSSQSSNYSSALIVALDSNSTPPTARVLQRIVRPDTGLTKSRGNHQRLPNGHAFVGWSDNAYISEHDPDGKILMEARFQSRRFTTYRSYKFNFTATPAEPPVTKAFVYGNSAEKALTIIYVSWNGATEVKDWRFFGKQGASYEDLGTKARTGFETMFTVDGKFESIYAAALANNGSVIGRSPNDAVIDRGEWSAIPESSHAVSRPEQISAESILTSEPRRLVRIPTGFSASSGSVLALFPLSLLASVAYVLCRTFLRRSRADFGLPG